MISCTDFIPAYSELFKYLEKQAGHDEVVRYWDYIRDNFLDNLRKLVQEKGLQGCWEYWSHTLNEEAADFTMELDEDAGEFRIIMHHCPSKGRLLELAHIEPYHDYCGHCPVLYGPILQEYGFHYEMDLAEVDKARCSMTVRRPQ